MKIIAYRETLIIQSLFQFRGKCPHGWKSPFRFYWCGLDSKPVIVQFFKIFRSNFCSLKTTYFLFTISDRISSCAGITSHSCEVIPVFRTRVRLFQLSWEKLLKVKETRPWALAQSGQACSTSTRFWTSSTWSWGLCE